MEKSNQIELVISDAYISMTNTEKVVADYVMQNLELVPSLSIKELAKNSGTSEASVLRFCKTVGYKGYRDFTIRLSGALGYKTTGSGIGNKKYTDIQMGDSLSTIIENVSYNNMKSLEDTLSVLDENEIRKAVSILCSTVNVCWFGLEASGLVCKDAEQKFCRIKKLFRAFTDVHGIKTAASLLGSDDAVVFVSNSGETPEILDALDLVKRNGARIIAITRYTRSRLAMTADVCLRISTPELTFRSAAMGSRIAMLNIVDILFTSVASETYDETKTYLDKTWEALAYRKN